VLLVADVEDDLLEEFGMYYRREDGLLVYQNGVDNDRYLVNVTVTNIGKE
jgi:hypothetical protein